MNFESNDLYSYRQASKKTRVAGLLSEFHIKSKLFGVFSFIEIKLFQYLIFIYSKLSYHTFYIESTLVPGGLIKYSTGSHHSIGVAMSKLIRPLTLPLHH